MGWFIANEKTLSEIHNIFWNLQVISFKNRIDENYSDENPVFFGFNLFLMQDKYTKY